MYMPLTASLTTRVCARRSRCRNLRELLHWRVHVGWCALVTVALTAAHVEGLAGLGVPEVLEAIQTLGLAASSRSHTIRVPTVRENTAFLVAHAEAELLVLKASPWAVRATLALA